VRQGEAVSLPGAWHLVLEDKTSHRAEGKLPPDLPPGYHELMPRDVGARTVRLIVTPGRCHLPAGLRAFGLAVQAYALRSAASLGIGDLGDLRRIGRFAAQKLTADLLITSPLFAAAPGAPQEPSPYFPTSRLFLNPLAVKLEEVPGAAEAGLDRERIAARGRELDAERRIDRDAVYALKSEALRQVFGHFTGDGAFDRFRTERGEALTRFASFCALAERHGRDWRRWPEEFRRPDAPAVARFALAEAARVRFHEWVQWVLDDQLARVATEIGVVQDLPLGFDPGGADAWAFQDLLAAGVTVGAPPDEFNGAGQDFGVPAFVPWKLRQDGYEPFIRTVRAALRHARGLRIDHIPGLSRLYWIAPGFGAGDGAYVRYPLEEMLAILAVESERAKAFIVGEDLGTVEAGLRAKLMDHQVLTTRILWFEREPPVAYPERALAAVTTHDLPTVAGLWMGTDLELQRQAGLAPNEAGWREVRARLKAWAGLPNDAPVERAIVGAYRLLAECRSAVVAISLDDVLGAVERPNMPGAAPGAYPSFSLALPVSLEGVEASPVPRIVASIVSGRRRRSRAVAGRRAASVPQPPRPPATPEHERGLPDLTGEGLPET
jgi:4-alpha-glucanotransferase